MAPVVGSGTPWTDELMVVLTAVAVLGGLVTLWLSFRQLKQQTQELRAQTALREAQRAMDLMRMLSDLGRAFVEHPDLAPYFNSGKEPPSEGALRAQVLAQAAGYMSLAEATGWQIHVGQMGDEGADAWRDYFSDLYGTTPALKSVVDGNRRMLAAETQQLFGLDPGPASPRTRS